MNIILMKQNSLLILGLVVINSRMNSYGMMGSGGMMNIMGSGMMRNLGYNFDYWGFLNVLYVILLIGFIILVYLWILKSWKSMKNIGGRK